MIIHNTIQYNEVYESQFQFEILEQISNVTNIDIDYLEFQPTENDNVVNVIDDNENHLATIEYTMLDNILSYEIKIQS
jgi:hypothetical protein